MAKVNAPTVTSFPITSSDSTTLSAKLSRFFQYTHYKQSLHAACMRQKIKNNWIDTFMLLGLHLATICSLFEK